MARFVYYATWALFIVAGIFIFLGDYSRAVIACALSYYWHALYHKEWTRRALKKLKEKT